MLLCQLLQLLCNIFTETPTSPLLYTLSHLWIEKVTVTGDDALISLGTADCLLVRLAFSTTLFSQYCILTNNSIQVHAFLISDKSLCLNQVT